MDTKYDFYHMSSDERVFAIYEIAQIAGLHGFDERAILRYGVKYMGGNGLMDRDRDSNITVRQFTEWALDWQKQIESRNR